MKLILILLVAVTLNSCLNKDKQILEPNPQSIKSLSESIDGNKEKFDYSGVLSLEQISVPINHSRDTIEIHIYPTRRVVANWRYLEEKTLSQKLNGNNRYEDCLVKFYTFENFRHEVPIIENLSSSHILLTLDGKNLKLNTDYKWSVESDHFEIKVNNPHLKGAELKIINNTIRGLHYKWLDTRNCAKTKHLKHTKEFAENKLDSPEHYVFDYSIY